MSRRLQFQIEIGLRDSERSYESASTQYHSTSRGLYELRQGKWTRRASIPHPCRGNCIDGRKRGSASLFPLMEFVETSRWRVIQYNSPQIVCIILWPTDLDLSKNLLNANPNSESSENGISRILGINQSINQSRRSDALAVTQPLIPAIT